MATLDMSLNYQIGFMRKDLDRMNDISATTMLTLADATSNEKHIKDLDQIFRGLSGETAKYQETIRLAEELKRSARGGEEHTRAAIEKLVSTLEKKDFAQDLAKVAFLKNDDYKDFVEKNRSKVESIGEGMEMDDELAVVSDGPSNAANMKDWYSQALLHKDPASGKYPVMMPCGHLYNWDTVMGRSNKKNQIWTVEKCCVAGCNKGLWPKDRDGLTEHKKTKNAIQRRDKGLSQAQEPEEESQMIEDL
mmetsp:Transcript_5297/g.12777  ORF Transcript_5297/g.12777 Transcript_5297/m.12777 type:complete len:249 (+) Transcript_5297:115-861(+)